jgi:uncharacterized protein
MTDAEIRDILSSAKTVAVVGSSNNPARASFGVSRFLQRHGYRVIPVNPNETEVLGEASHASVADISDQIDIVDIFRKSEAVPEVVDQAIRKGGVKCVWMQEGVISQEGASRAAKAGIPVVMDRCILKELARLLP